MQIIQINHIKFTFFLALTFTFLSCSNAQSQFGNNILNSFSNFVPYMIEDGMNNQILANSQRIARNEVLKFYRLDLGALIKYSQQMAGGVNIKLIFNSKVGYVQVLVNCQPWIDTYKIHQIKSLGFNA